MIVHVTCCLEAICKGNHPSFLNLLPGSAAGDDTEDTSTEFTDSIEEEAAHRSHQQVSQGQVLGFPGWKVHGPSEALMPPMAHLDVE